MTSQLASDCGSGGWLTVFAILGTEKGPYFLERLRAEVRNIPQNIDQLSL